MSARDDGGPAFPSNRDMRHNPDWDHEPGLSLRDYFAAKAMQIAHADQPDCAFDELAQLAYVLADAMLAERAK